MKNRLGGVLRALLIVLMGATTAMTLLGAVGTICLAFNADKYGALGAAYVPQMPTYQILVYIKFIVAVAMLAVTYAIVRGEKWFYAAALVVLVLGGGAAAIQMYTSSVQRNIAFLSVAPTNIRFYITLVTLVVFALVRFPGIWNKSRLGDASRPGSPTAAGGVALMVAGILILSTPIWAGPAHMLDGINMVNTLLVPLVVDGIAMVLGGAALIIFRDQLAALCPKWRPTRARKVTNP